MIAAKLNTKEINVTDGPSPIKPKSEKKPEKGLFGSILQAAQHESKQVAQKNTSDNDTKVVDGQKEQKAEHQEGKVSSNVKNEDTEKKTNDSNTPDTADKAEQKNEKKVEAEINTSESKEGKDDKKESEKIEEADPKIISAEKVQPVSVSVESSSVDKAAAIDEEAKDVDGSEKKGDQKAVDNKISDTGKTSQKVEQPAPVKTATADKTSAKDESVDDNAAKKSLKIEDNSSKSSEKTKVQIQDANNEIKGSEKDSKTVVVDENSAANVSNEEDGSTQEGAQTTAKSSAGDKNGDVDQTNKTKLSNPSETASKAVNEKAVNKGKQNEEKGMQLANDNTASDQQVKNVDDHNNHASKPGFGPHLRKVNDQNAAANKKVQTPAEVDKTAADKNKPVEVSEEGKVEKSVKKAQNSQVINENPQIRNIKAEQLRDKKYRDHLASFVRSGESDNARSGDGNTRRKIFNAKSVDPVIAATNPDSGGDNGSEFTDANDADIFWKDHIVETSGGKEHKAAEQSTFNFMRLGQIPVSNISLKRSALPTITQKILKAVGRKSVKEAWQKHSFVLEDGKNIHLSTRQIDGVMQLKLSSSHAELKQLLQQHYQEIKKHLEQELNIQVDLQFDANSDQNTSGFFGDSSSFENRGQGSKSFSGKGTGAGPIKTDSQSLLKTVRKFGYNRMEWTA